MFLPTLAALVFYAVTMVISNLYITVNPPSTALQGGLA
jgi:hypothetical protein